jgi:hypothetical protein
MRRDRRQTEAIEVKWGRLRLRELVTEVPLGAAVAGAKVRAAGEARSAAVRQDGRRINLTLDKEAVLEAGQAVTAELDW